MSFGVQRAKSEGCVGSFSKGKPSLVLKKIMSKFFRSCSSKGNGLEGEEYVEKGNDLVKWKMPTVPTRKIYQAKSLFSFSSDPSIRTSEGKLSYGKGGGAFRLLEEAPSSWNKGRFYSVMNIGLVQVGIKTITRKIPSNASIVVCLRDNRIEKVPDSLLAMVESNLNDGPFYFNVYPNINLSLQNSSLPDVLTVHVRINGLQQLPDGAQPIVLTCRSCYKLNKNNFGPEALLESPVGKTVFYQTEIQEKNDVVQKLTNWDQVQLPPEWPPQLQKRKSSRLVFSSEGGVTRVTQVTEN